MSRTVSTTRPPPAADGSVGQPDLDGRMAVDNESLAQRIRCAFRFRLGEYFLDNTRGLDYDLLFNRVITPAQASRVLVDVIRKEGGSEVRDITDVEYRVDTISRRFIFSCTVQTIHGDIAFDTEI